MFERLGVDWRCHEEVGKVKIDLGVQIASQTSTTHLPGTAARLPRRKGKGGGGTVHPKMPILFFLLDCGFFLFSRPRFFFTWTCVNGPSFYPSYPCGSIQNHLMNKFFLLLHHCRNPEKQTAAEVLCFEGGPAKESKESKETQKLGLPLRWLLFSDSGFFSFAIERKLITEMRRTDGIVEAARTTSFGG